MGTRSLVIVIKNRVVKLAQYGQFDGYPEGQGLGIIETLQGKLAAFSDALDKLHFITKEEEQAIYKSKDEAAINALHDGYKVFPYILDGSVTGVVDNYQFAAESLWCEWCYVLDFDRDTLEVYKGFNRKELTPEDRFYPLEKFRDTSTPFHPVKLLCEFKLNNLPKEEEFLHACKTARNPVK